MVTQSRENLVVTDTDGTTLERFYERANHTEVVRACDHSRFYGQAERAISNGQLHVLPHFHIRPIHVVVYDGPSEAITCLGDLILRKVSRLYAFSAYPNRTSLPSYATGVTTGTQEVRPLRSSRTKSRPLQISYAHHR